MERLSESNLLWVGRSHLLWVGKTHLLWVGKSHLHWVRKFLAWLQNTDIRQFRNHRQIVLILRAYPQDLHSQ